MTYVNLILLLAIVSTSGLAGEARYRVVTIYPPAGVDAYAIAALGVNDYGAVAGEYGFWGPTPEDPNRSVVKAFTFSGGTNAVELSLDQGVVTSAVGINNLGQVALYGSSVYPLEFAAYRFTPGRGVEWLGSFGGQNTETEAINVHGQVTGFSEDPAGGSYAFRYTDGIGFENIGTNFAGNSRGFGINDEGSVCGWADGKAFVYSDGGGVIEIGPGRAYGINNLGTVVGVSWSSLVDRAFIYRDGELTIVGPDSSDDYRIWTVLGDINNYDIGVGVGVHGDHKVIALIWDQREGLTRLNSLIAVESGWWLTAAAAINDRGQIVGQGVFNGAVTAYRLDPIPPKLAMEQSGTNVVVSWSPAWPGVVLEGAENLSGASWGTVATGGTNYVTVPLTNQMHFFRLNLDALRGLCCAPE